MSYAKRMKPRQDQKMYRRGYKVTKKINQSNSGAMQLGGRRF